MTKSWTLFKQLFKQKSKTAYLLIIIQLIAAFVITLFGIFNSEGMDQAEFIGVPMHDKLLIYMITFVISFLVLSIFTDFAYFIMTSWKNEKINRSQTWQLIPINSEKFYVINTLSSFLSFVYLCVLQALVGIIGAITFYVGSNEFRKGIAELITAMNKEHVWSQIDWGLIGEEFILVLLLGLAWYITVSFYHFITRTIIDFLPDKAARLTAIIVRIVMLILVIWLLIEFLNITFAIYESRFINPGLGTDIGIAIANFAIFDIIFGGINIALFKKFVEAKGNR
ncbi:hypothetical protein [Lactobacillus sp. LL6]|uniref:hypothetical protein n=1 Tax=Lactobacillus sp. LL6 TaxID=2596827 RepID=UPI0011869879|nr:hypothetical protein [Lactobacillus sp. LL6]TSO26356.1 hypothetical protein FOD82_04625 [Lactobacillus sp. LL6]